MESSKIRQPAIHAYVPVRADEALAADGHAEQELSGG